MGRKKQGKRFSAGPGQMEITSMIERPKSNTISRMTMSQVSFNRALLIDLIKLTP